MQTNRNMHQIEKSLKSTISGAVAARAKSLYPATNCNIKIYLFERKEKGTKGGGDNLCNYLW